MSDLKKQWQETGKDLSKAFMTLGKAVVESAKVGIDKAGEWLDKKETKQSNTNDEK